MITINLLKLLENENIGTLALNGWTSSIGSRGLYWQDMPIKSDGKDAEGIWVISRQGVVSQVNTGFTPFDIYARFSSPFKGSEKLEEIMQLLKTEYQDTCELPIVIDVPYTYTNVRVKPVGSVQNIGQDLANNTVWSLSGELRYNRTPRP